MNPAPTPGPTPDRPPSLSACIPPCPLSLFRLFAFSPHPLILPGPKCALAHLAKSSPIILSPLPASRFTLHEMRKQTQFPLPQNHRNPCFIKHLPQYPAPPHQKKQTVRQAKLVQFSRCNPARSKVSHPAGMNMYA